MVLPARSGRNLADIALYFHHKKRSANYKIYPVYIRYALRAYGKYGVVDLDLLFGANFVPGCRIHTGHRQAAWPEHSAFNRCAMGCRGKAGKDESDIV